MLNEKIKKRKFFQDNCLLLFNQYYLNSQGMGVAKRLTEMQIKFCHELVANAGTKTATEAAIAAGYSKDAATVMAST